MKMMRVLLTLALTVFTYAALFVLPAITTGMLQQPAQNNGYSPYTMFQRCHPAQFNIPAGNC
jgi:hypothetical protein